MNVTIENFKTGWFGLQMGIADAEIAVLIDRLQELQETRGNFHFRSDFSGSGGVGDVEIFWAESGDENNMNIE